MKNLNLISHQNLLDYGNKVLDIYKLEFETDLLFESALEAKKLFEAKLMSISPTVRSDLEKLDAAYFSLWDQIISTLQNNLNIEIEDPVNILEFLDLTRESALMCIPEYASSCNVFGSVKAIESTFHPFNNAFGNYWPHKDMNALIESLCNPVNKENCRNAKIEGFVNNLQLVVKQISTLGENSDITNNLFRELRNERIEFCRIIVLLDSDFCSFKVNPSRKFKAYELFSDRLLVADQSSELEKFSLNDLSLDSFYSLLLRFRESLPKNNKLIDKLPDDIFTQIEQFEEILFSFKSSQLYESFQSNETNFYRKFEMLLFGITSNIRYVASDDQNAWNAHTQTAPYKTALSLFADIGQSPYSNLSKWQRGELLQPNMVLKILKMWDITFHRNHLTILGLEELFDSCINSEDAARTIADDIFIDNSKADINSLREARYSAGLIISMVDCITANTHS
jgi:hypothetical protein